MPESNLLESNSLSIKPKNAHELFIKISIGLCAILLTIFLTLYRNELRQTEVYGYPGVLVACFMANSTVFLPAPSSAIVFNFGAIYNPFYVAIAGGTGAALGDYLGYLAGLAGRVIAQRTKMLIILESWLDNNGPMAVFIFAFLPLPLFDVVGVLAGASSMRWYKFIPSLLAGKILKMLIYAYTGAGLVPLLEPYIRVITKN